MEQTGLDFLDLRTLLSVTWRGKILISALSIAGAAALYGLTYLVTPIYRVSAIVADASDQSGSQALMSALGQLGSLASIAGVGVGGQAKISEEALAVLTSDDFLTAFIARHDLLPALYSDDWSQATGKWTVARNKQPTMAKAIRKLRTFLTTERDRRAGLITLSVEWKDPAQAEIWCQMLIDDVNAEMQRRTLDKSKDYMGYLRKQMDVEATLETRQAISRLMEAQLKQQMLASVNRDFVFRVVSAGRQPERDRYVRPKRMIFAALGFMLGFGIGVVASYLRIERRATTT